MLQWEEKWLALRQKPSSSTSKAHRVDSFASDTAVFRSCEGNSGLCSLWLCQRENQILKPLLGRSTALIFAGSPEDPVLISLLPISLTPLSATLPSCFSPLHLWNLSFSFIKGRDTTKTTKTDIDQPPRALLEIFINYFQLDIGLGLNT